MNKLTNVVLLAAGVVLPMVASRVSRRVLGAGYEAVVDSPAPKNPASISTGWKEAITWSLMAGALGGMARLVTRRALAHTAVPTSGYYKEDQ